MFLFRKPNQNLDVTLLRAHNRIEFSKKARREDKIGRVEGRGGEVDVCDQQMRSSQVVLKY